VVNGDGLALGLPVGNSGASIVCTPANGIPRRKEHFGYAVLGTGSMAPAVILELPCSGYPVLYREMGV